MSKNIDVEDFEYDDGLDSLIEEKSMSQFSFRKTITVLILVLFLVMVGLLIFVNIGKNLLSTRTNITHEKDHFSESMINEDDLQFAVDDLESFDSVDLADSSVSSDLKKTKKKTKNTWGPSLL